MNEENDEKWDSAETQFFSQPQAVHLQVNPLLFIVPVTIAISFAFILPISSVNDKIFFCLQFNVCTLFSAFERACLWAPTHECFRNGKWLIVVTFPYYFFCLLNCAGKTRNMDEYHCSRYSTGVRKHFWSIGIHFQCFSRLGQAIQCHCGQLLHWLALLFVCFCKYFCTYV